MAKLTPFYAFYFHGSRIRRALSKGHLISVPALPDYTFVLDKKEGMVYNVETGRFLCTREQWDAGFNPSEIEWGYVKMALESHIKGFGKIASWSQDEYALIPRWWAYVEEFKLIFGLDLENYFGGVQGFNLFKFEVDLPAFRLAEPETSMKEVLRGQFGPVAVKLVEDLIDLAIPFVPELYFRMNGG